MRCFEERSGYQLLHWQNMQGWIGAIFIENLQAKQMVEDAQLKQGECYNPKKAIFDRATEEVNKQLKRQMILYKRRIKELELQIELLEEENQRLKENR